MEKITRCLLITVVLDCQSQESYGDGISFVLGGSWFEDSTVGQKGGYLRTEYKNKALDPVIEQIADHVFNNYSNLGINFWVSLIF